MDMPMKKLLIFILSAAGIVAPAMADEPAPIVSSIESDSVSVVVQPEELNNRLKPGEIPSAPSRPDEQVSPGGHQRTTQAGWRIQVYSDSNGAKAKSNARRREQTVASRFPQYRAYTRYSPPYWRVRIGDFKSQSEANAAMSELKRAFPGFAKEMRVVRDRIIVIN